MTVGNTDDNVSVNHLKFKQAVTGASQDNKVTRTNDIAFIVIPQARHTIYTN